MFQDHFDVYKSSVKFLPDCINKNNIFLEIGAGTGSTQFWAKTAQTHGQILHSVDIEDHGIVHSNLVYHVAQGSTWTKQVLPGLNSQISFFFSDNMGYLWDSALADSTYEHSQWNRKIYKDLRGPDWPEEFTPWHLLDESIQQEVITNFNRQGLPKSAFDKVHELVEWYKKRGLTMTNNASQVENLKQIIDVAPYLAERCLVVFHGTLQYNDCWIGKCGPGVVYLQTLGFHIAEIYPMGVALTR
jgi:hypothetical protein